jgi:hypothetical protein
VRPPSLYAHITGLPDLRRRLAARGARRLAAAMQTAAAGRARGDALAAVADALPELRPRAPGQLRSASARARSRRRGDQGRRAQAVDVVLAVLRGYGLESDDAIHPTRIIRAALHGFVSLEAGGGFGLPLDVDETFARLTRLLDQGLAAATPTAHA